MLSVLWSIPVVLKAINDVPTFEQEMAFWRTSAERQVPGMQVKAWERDACQEQVKKTKPDNPYLEQAVCEQASLRMTQEDSDQYNRIIEMGRKDASETVPRRQLIHFAMAAAVWLIPIALLYAAGWTAGWVVRGFQKPQR